MAFGLTLLEMVLVSRIFYVFKRQTVQNSKIVAICLIQIFHVFCYRISLVSLYFTTIILAINLPGLLLEKRTDNLLKWRAISLLIYILFWVPGIALVPNVNRAEYLFALQTLLASAGAPFRVIIENWQTISLVSIGFLLAVSETNLRLRLLFHRLAFTTKIEDTQKMVIDNRPVRIGDFVDEHIDEGFHYASALTMNGDGKAVYDRIVGMHKNPAPEKLIRIVTKSGDELLLTSNHRIAVDRPEGMAWVRADELREGERVYSLKQLNLLEGMPQVIDILPEDLRVGDEAMITRITSELRAKYGSLAAAHREIGLELPNPKVKSISLADLKRIVAALDEDWDQIKASIHEVVSTSGHRFALPELSADLFYILGLLASDGSIVRRGKHECFINCVNSDEGLIAAFEEAYANAFPGRKLGQRRKDDSISRIEGREIRSTKDCFDCYGANPLLGIISEHFGVKMDGEERWDLGRMISLPRHLIAAFIAGHFDGDGSVRLRKYDGKWDVGEAYLCIDDKRAARHLQLLLKRLGIVGNLRQSNSIYKIELHGSNLRRFAELIPSRHPDKGQTLR